MNKFYSLLLFLIINYVNGFSQGDVSVARLMEKPVSIDGINSEWGALNFYDEQTQLSFAIGNDSNNIYMCFQAADEAVQMKIMRAGMKVTLESKNKPKHEASIVFPLQQNKEMQQEPPQTINGDTANAFSKRVYNKESFMQNFMNHHPTMQLTGFVISNGEVSTKDLLVNIAMNRDTASNLIYEICIAKKDFFGPGYASAKNPGEITLNVEINGLKDAGDGGKNGEHAQWSGGTDGGDKMHGASGTHSGSKGADFNNAREQYAQTVQASGNINHASLTTKTSFKQKFILNNGNE